MMHATCRLTPLCSTPAGDADEAVAQVAQLLASQELRQRVGAAGRAEVSLWDWRAATQHLLQVQYPLAMAAAAAYYGRSMSRAAEAAGFYGSGSSDAGAAGGMPAVAA